ncbi:MAG: FtsX-like permease family protein, partial [Alloacidobacterium sp.]
NGVTIYQATEDFYTRLLDHINTLPGVDSAAVVSWLPMEYSTGRRERMFQISGHAQSDPSHKPVSDFNTITPGYFDTLRIPLVEGRTFTPGDNGTTPWVAIVNQAFARRYLMKENPIGRILITDGGVGERPREIIGVVADVHQDTLDKQPEPEIYTPFLQQPAVASGHGYQNRVHMNVVIHISGDANSTIASVRKIAAELDSNQPIYDVQTLPDVVSETTALNRLHASLLEIFAVIALLLSAIGIYGSMCQTVNERTAEIGLRIAVGATTSDLYRLILLRGLKLVLSGLLVGLLLAMLFERVLTSVLFGVTPHDPVSLIAVCSLLFAVAMVAMSIPARRAMRVDPVTALHYE